MPMHPHLTGKSQQSAKNASAAGFGKWKGENKTGKQASASGFKTRTSATDVSAVHPDFKSRSRNAAG